MIGENERLINLETGISRAVPDVDCMVQFITGNTITISATPIEPESNWQDRANCLDNETATFFPAQGGSSRRAKEICMGCEVRYDCLEYALQTSQKFGIWGGLSERERSRIKKQRARAARSTIGA